MEARQQSWPRIWLMTDERMGDSLWDAVARLPDGAGIASATIRYRPRFACKWPRGSPKARSDAG